METLEFIAKRYSVELKQRSPIYLPAKREDLAYIIHDLGFMTGAEIGVEQGLFSEHICKYNPQMKFYAIDAWTAYKGYRDHVSQERLDGFMASAKERLSKYHCQVMKGYSHEVASEFGDGSLDFVYIDGNHEFFQVAQDIAYWTPKVRKGGIIAGHDFKRDSGRDWVCHVKDVVQAWAYSHSIDPWFVLKGSGNPSWMWVC